MRKNRINMIIGIALAILGVSTLFAASAEAQTFSIGLTATVPGAPRMAAMRSDASGAKMLYIAKDQSFVLSMLSVVGEQRCVMLSPAQIAGTGWARNSAGKHEMAPISPDHPWHPAKTGKALAVKVQCQSVTGQVASDEVRILVVE